MGSLRSPATRKLIYPIARSDISVSGASLANYITERIIILNQAYRYAMNNQNTETMKWLLEINPNIDTNM